MKTTKIEAPKSKKNYNIKAKFLGLCNLAVALAELATVYIMVTQGNNLLLPIVAVLGLDSAQRFATKFLK
jgi:hypothetical protein